MTAHFAILEQNQHHIAIFNTRVGEKKTVRPVRNMRAVNIRQTLADQFLEVLEVVVAENTALLPEGEASHTHNTASHSTRA
jgi:hypothetical protein